MTFKNIAVPAVASRLDGKPTPNHQEGVAAVEQSVCLRSAPRAHHFDPFRPSKSGSNVDFSLRAGAGGTVDCVYGAPMLRLPRDAFPSNSHWPASK